MAVSGAPKKAVRRRTGNLISLLSFLFISLVILLVHRIPRENTLHESAICTGVSAEPMSMSTISAPSRVIPKTEADRANIVASVKVLLHQYHYHTTHIYSQCPS
jgi:hypothetical protein